MSTEKKDHQFIKKPVYPGGLVAMKTFISQNLKYPEEAVKNKIEGTVLVKYDIDYQGNVSEAKVIKGIDKACDEEALRVVKLLKFKVPKNPRNLKVLFHKEAKINFRLSKPKKTTGTIEPQISEPHIDYTITEAKKDKKIPSKPITYNYTINW